MLYWQLANLHSRLLHVESRGQAGGPSRYAAEMESYEACTDWTFQWRFGENLDHSAGVLNPTSSYASQLIHHASDLLDLVSTIKAGDLCKGPDADMATSCQSKDRLKSPVVFVSFWNKSIQNLIEEYVCLEFLSGLPLIEWDFAIFWLDQMQLRFEVLV